MQEIQTSETSHTAIETEDFAALLHAQNEKLVSEMTLEEKRAKVAAFNIMDDAFFHKMMEDKEVCEESLRIILQEPNLKVLSCQPQSSLKNLNGKSAILDVKCSFSDGRHCNIEVQKADDDDHEKRVRYNATLLTSNLLPKGEKYKELPDVIVIFISKFDVFKSGYTIYHIDRIVRETGKVTDNGFHEVYVNTKIDDGSAIAELMKYYGNTKPENESCHFPKIVDRVNQYKQNEKEVTDMCEIMERERKKGIEIGKKQGVEIGKKQGVEIGKKQGVEIGIFSTIEILLEMIPVEDISPRIKSKYSLSDEQAQYYIQTVLQKRE